MPWALGMSFSLVADAHTWCSGRCLLAGPD